MSQPVEDTPLDTEADTVSSAAGKSRKKNRSRRKKKAPASGLPTGQSLSPAFTACSTHFRVVQEERRGRCAYAKEKIAAGECVLREKPYALRANGASMCATCGCIPEEKETSLRVNISDFVFFCSETCMEEYSSVNPEIVGLINTIKDSAAVHNCDVDLLFITFHILRHIHSYSDNLENDLFVDYADYMQSTAAGFMAQLSHCDQQNSSWVASVRAAAVHVLESGAASWLLSNCSVECASDMAIGVASRVNVNSYGVVADVLGTRKVCGFGAFPIAAMLFNHSCAPNIANVFVDGRMEYRTLREISAGEELCVSYIDCTQSLHLRRDSLLKTKFFMCHCSRCSAHDMALESTVTCKAPTETAIATSVLADLMLEGLYCSDCGPAGVVVCFEPSNKEEGESPYRCVVCGKQGPAGSERVNAIAADSWKAVSRSLGPGLAPNQALLSIERWMVEFDPGFTQPISGLSTTQQRRVRLAHGIPLQLHPAHYLFIDVNVAYFNALMASGHDDLRSFSRLKIGHDIMSNTVPDRVPEKAVYELMYAEAIESFLKKNLPKKTAQSWRKEMYSLRDSAALCKCILHIP